MTLEAGDNRIAYCAGLGFPGGSAVKNPPAMQEIRVQSLGREDPLEKEMATHSSILAWEIPWTEEPGGLQSMVLQRAGHDRVTNTHTYTLTHTLHWANRRCPPSLREICWPFMKDLYIDYRNAALHLSPNLSKEDFCYI